MQITFIGTASGLSVTHRSHASILFETDGYGTLIDCGEGTTRSLVKLGIDTNSIERVIISHTHPDHCAGLPLLLQYMHLIGRENPLKIYLPKGMKDTFLRFLEQLYMISETLPFDYTIEEYGAEETITGGGLTIEPIPNRHLEDKAEIARKYGISLATFSLVAKTGDKIVYYSADIKDAEDFSLPAKTDIAIVESTHIDLEAAMQIAAARRIKRLIFTHIHPDVEGVALTDKFGLQAEFAYDGLTVNI